METGRYTNTEKQLRLCTYCNNKGMQVVEDEWHVVFVCELYSDIRNKYLTTFTENVSNPMSLVNLLKSNDTQTLYKFANFLYYAQRKINDKFNAQRV